MSDPGESSSVAKTTFTSFPSFSCLIRVRSWAADGRTAVFLGGHIPEPLSVSLSRALGFGSPLHNAVNPACCLAFHEKASVNKGVWDIPFAVRISRSLPLPETDLVRTQVPQELGFLRILRLFRPTQPRTLRVA
jgi:hypothetical protein